MAAAAAAAGECSACLRRRIAGRPAGVSIGLF